MMSLVARFRPCTVLLAGAAAILCCFSHQPSYGQFEPPGLFEQVVPGLLGRTRFKSDAGGSRIEIIELLVGPETISEPMPVRSGAMLDAVGGEGSLIVDGNLRRIKPGDVLPLSQNQTITFDNSGAARPLMMRLILFSRVSN
jgi:hypothetical protein